MTASAASVLIVENDPEVPPGRLAACLDGAGIAADLVRPYAGDRLPLPSSRAAVVVLGGTMGVGETAKHPFLLELKRFLAKALGGGTPLLGICLGGQLLAEALGGSVTPGFRGEKGVCRIGLTDAGVNDPLFAGLPSVLPMFQWHGDSFAIPPGALHLAATDVCPGQAFRWGNAWGVQFHPEVTGAIVSAWCRDEPAGGPDIPAAFSAVEAECGRSADRLFGNFLRIAGLR